MHKEYDNIDNFLILVDLLVLGVNMFYLSPSIFKDNTLFK